MSYPSCEAYVEACGHDDDHRVMIVQPEPPRTHCDWFFPIGRYVSSAEWYSIGTPRRELNDAEASCSYCTGLAEIRFLRVSLPVVLVADGVKP